MAFSTIMTALSKSLQSHLRSWIQPVLAAGILAVTPMGAANAELARVTIATGPAGTLYHQIGTTLSVTLQEKLGVPSTARPFGGTSQYLPMLHRGEVTAGINAGLDSSIAFRGEDEYTQPLTEVRALMRVVRAPYAFFVKGTSGITTMTDLKGKPVITGYRAVASFDRVNAALLATADLSVDDVDGVVVAAIPDAIRALVDDRVVASATILGIPALREADATISGGLRVLPLGENEAALEELAGFSATTLQPGPAFVGVKEPTRVARFDSFLNVSASLSDDDAYTLAKTFYENWAEIQDKLAALRSVPQNELAPVRFSHPYHPGAVRFFKEVGIWTDAHEKRQKEILAN